MNGITIALSKLNPLLQNHTELYQGQHNEIVDMVNSPGCDICEHVPTLIKYGKEAKHITEMGVRFGWSTRSFIFSEPEVLISIDKFEWNSIDQSGAPGPKTLGSGNSQYKRYKELLAGRLDHQFILGDTTKIDVIQPTDLLFIDTFHHGDCLFIELERHGNQAQKYIILHDTETFGRNGQEDDTGVFFKPNTKGGIGTGLLDALGKWLPNNPHWTIKEHYKNNNGLTILERK
jgi:hypothetical protein